MLYCTIPPPPSEQSSSLFSCFFLFFHILFHHNTLAQIATAHEHRKDGDQRDTAVTSQGGDGYGPGRSAGDCDGHGPRICSAVAAHPGVCASRVQGSLFERRCRVVSERGRHRYPVGRRLCRRTRWLWPHDHRTEHRRQRQMAKRSLHQRCVLPHRHVAEQGVDRAAAAAALARLDAQAHVAGAAGGGDGVLDGVAAGDDDPVRCGAPVADPRGPRLLQEHVCPLVGGDGHGRAERGGPVCRRRVARPRPAAVVAPQVGRRLCLWPASSGDCGCRRAAALPAGPALQQRPVAQGHPVVGVHAGRAWVRGGGDDDAVPAAVHGGAQHAVRRRTGLHLRQPVGGDGAVQRQPRHGRLCVAAVVGAAHKDAGIDRVGRCSGKGVGGSFVRSFVYPDVLYIT